MNIKDLYPVIFLLLIVPGVFASGGSHTSDTHDETGNGLSLEILAIIAATFGLVLLTVLQQIIKFKDKRLLLVMMVTALVFLGLDYYYLKYHYYA